MKPFPHLKRLLIKLNKKLLDTIVPPSALKLELLAKHVKIFMAHKITNCRNLNHHNIHFIMFYLKIFLFYISYSKKFARKHKKYQKLRKNFAKLYRIFSNLIGLIFLLKKIPMPQKI